MNIMSQLEKNLEQLKKSFNGKHLITWMLDSIKPMAPNHSVIAKHIHEQMEMVPDNDEFVKLYSLLIGMIQYVPLDTIMKTMLRKARALKKALDKKEDKRFYMVVQCNDVVTNGPDMSFMLALKSNTYMSVMFLCMYPQLVDHFVDFICMGPNTEPFALHGQFSTDIKTHVLVDDVSLTGRQASNILTCPPSIIGNFRTLGISLVSAVLFESREAKGLINWHGVTGIYTWVNHLKSGADITPEEVSLDRIKVEMKKQFKLKYGGMHYVNTLDGDFYDDDSIEELWDTRMELYLEFLGIEEDKYLFYTDIKIPDDVSVSPTFLMNPPIVVKNNNNKLEKLKRRNEPLISNVDATSGLVDDGYVKAGTYMEPVYKSDKWNNGLFVDLLKTRTE